MNLLDPWWSVEKEDADYHKTFIQELQIEIPSGHKIFELPVKMLGSDKSPLKAYKELHHYCIFLDETGCHEFFAESACIAV